MNLVRRRFWRGLDEFTPLDCNPTEDVSWEWTRKAEVLAVEASEVGIVSGADGAAD